MKTQRLAAALLLLCLATPVLAARPGRDAALLFHAPTHGVARSHPNGDDVAIIDPDSVVVPASEAAVGPRTVDAVAAGGTAAVVAGVVPAPPQQQPRAANSNNKAHPPPPSPPREPQSPWPPTGRDLVALAVIVFALSLVGGAGIGGGAILVPSLILIEGFSTGTAVALSNITILGGSLANFLANAPRRRGGGNGEPLIDWGIITQMEPTTIVGALLGGYLNRLLPNAITVTLLTLLLVFMTARLYAKAVQSYAGESALLAARAAHKEAHQQQQQQLLGAVGAAGNGSDAINNGQRRPPPPVVTTGDRNSSNSLRRPLLADGATAAAGVSPLGGASPRSGVSSPQRRQHAARSLRASSSAFMSRALSSNHFQGDALGATLEPMVPARPSDDDDDGGGDDVFGGGGVEGVGEEHQGDGAQAAQHARTPPPPQLLPTPSASSAHAPHARRGSRLPPAEIAALLLLSAWVVASDVTKAALRCGSARYWLVTLSVLLPTSAVLWWSRTRLLRTQRRRDAAARAAGLPTGPAPGELHWTPTTTLLYPAICTLAGVIAGTFGIGGGVVKGPLLLELGVAPDVSAATSATMIVFTAGAASVVYARFGAINWAYGAPLFALGFFITLLSQLLTFYLIRMLGRRSVIIFMMSGLLAAACLIMSVQTGGALVDAAQHPEHLLVWGNICPRDEAAGGGGGAGCAVSRALDAAAALWTLGPVA